jgi:hypothetical protein
MDPTYERPILSRYVDPYELIWLATASRLRLHIRRDPAVYSMTDGSGLLALAPRAALDPDDTLAQQVLHEICHWIVAGRDAFTERDWGYELEVPLDDPREHACLRLQAWFADQHGLRGLMAPTGLYRPYWDALGPDALAPLDDSDHEAEVAELLTPAVERAQQAPWFEPVSEALAATARLHSAVAPFLADYASEIDDDPLPSLWGR